MRTVPRSISVAGVRIFPPTSRRSCYRVWPSDIGATVAIVSRGTLGAIILIFGYLQCIVGEHDRCRVESITAAAINPSAVSSSLLGAALISLAHCATGHECTKLGLHR